MAAQKLQYDHFEIQTDNAGHPIELGSATQGVTYQAFDKRLRKPVALKIVEPSLFSDENSRRRFFNEARAAAAIEHPNVARVTYLCPEDAAECFYAMELVDGESLAHRIEERGAMRPLAALQLLRPIADALITLGNHRLVHRDLQPANVMLTSDANGQPTVKLIDFGLAKCVGSENGLLEHVHTAELRSSSVFHLSPEQIHRERPVDFRSDFYSLGIMLWNAIAGKPPFTGSAFEVNEAHLRGELPWGQVEPLTDATRTLLRKLLAKDPDQRPHDAREVVALWDAAISSHENAAVAEEAVNTPATTVRATAKDSRKLKLQRLVPTPEGCSIPVGVGYLATDESGDTWYFIRSVPDSIPADARAEIFKQARAACDSPHPSLLNVREVREKEIVSEWRPTVAVARVVAARRGEVPPSMIKAWLPHVAEAVDAVRERSLSRVGLTPATWYLEFIGLENESPAQQATRDPVEWAPQEVWLDPLAGIDPVLALASADAAQTLLPAEAESFKTESDYLAAFARAVHELLGGSVQAPGAPLPSLDEASNILLRDALRGRSEFTSVNAWTDAFLSGVGTRGGLVAAASRPVGAAASPNFSPAPTVSPIRIAPPAARPMPRVGAADATSPLTRIMAKPYSRYVAAALGVLLVASLIMWAVNSRGRDGKSTTNAPSNAENDRREGEKALSDAEKAIQTGDYGYATAKLETAARYLPGDERVKSANLRLDEAKLAAESKGKTLTPAERLKAASKDHPFENSLGMKFVPLTTTADGKPVFCSIYETRVSDIQKWLKSIGRSQSWQPEPFQDGNHPAVKMLAQDATNFCSWLTKQEIANQTIPADWAYDLPDMREWGTANGSAKGAGYPWGASWPPPSGTANLADEKAAAKGLKAIPGYSDGFAFTAPVGSFSPNGLGIYDTVGNAAEWCIDADLKTYILRGGNWRSKDAQELKPTADPNNRENTNGFRVILAERRQRPPIKSQSATGITGGNPSQPALQAPTSVIYQPRPPGGSSGGGGAPVTSQGAQTQGLQVNPFPGGR